MLKAINENANWKEYPIIKEDTKISFYANAKEGIFTLEGYENGNPVTQTLVYNGD